MVIPPEIVDLLNKLSIEEVAPKLGMEVIRHKALCFNHNDHNPSITFSKTKNIYKCWVCGKCGGPIKLVQDKKGWSFQNACIWLADQFNIWRPTYEYTLKKTKKISKHIEKSPKKIEVYKRIDKDIGEWIVEHSILSDSAKHFLFDERKYNPEVVKALRIGSLTYPQKLIDKLIRLFGLKRCEQSGFFSKWNNSLHLCYKAPCLLFPYYDENGDFYSIQSRFLGEVKDKKDRFKFPKDIKQRLFNRPVLSDVANNEPLYVCEGVTDCIALLSSGKKAVAFPSSSICHPEDIRLLSSCYLFMYPDKDNAGEGLYKRLSEGLKPYSNVVHRAELPDGFKDYSEYYLSLQR